MEPRSEHWDFEEYGFKAVNWEFPQDDVPHCEIVLRLSTAVEKKGEETYSFAPPRPCEDQVQFLEQLKKSIELCIDEIKTKVKK